MSGVRDSSTVTSDPASDQEPASILAMSIPVISFLFILALYFLREFDDNRLVSWLWAFERIDVPMFFVSMALASVVAYMLATLELPGPRGLFIISIILGAFFMDVPEVIIDASRYFTQAKHLGLYGPGYFIEQWGRGIEAWTDLPLVPFIYGLGFRYLGEHREVVQAINLLMLASTAVVTCLLASDLFGQGAGRLAGVFMLSVPYLYTQTPLMMVDVASMCFLLLAIFSFRRGLMRGGLWCLVLAPATIALAFFTKYSLWLMLSATVPVFVLAFMEQRAALRRTLVITVVFAALVLPLLWHLRDVMASQLDLLISYQRPGLKRWGEGLFSTFFFHVHPFVTLAAMASAGIAIKRRDGWYVSVAWLVVLVLVLLGVRRIRYTIPLFPMVAIMAAYGAMRLRDEKALRTLAYSALVTSLVLASAAYVPLLSVSSLANLQHAGQRLDEIGVRQVRVSAMPQQSIINPAVSVPLLDLYTQAEIIYDYRLRPTRSPGEIAESPFRFTWTYKNPSYYKEHASLLYIDAHVIIARDIDKLKNYKLKGLFLDRIFDIHEGLFKFRPLAGIYI